MSNIEQALKAALAAIDLYDYTMTVEELEKFAKAERLCKSALAEIGKCEPVAWQFYQDGEWYNGMDTNNHKQNTIAAGFPVRGLYDKPQSCEWKSLNEAEFDDIAYGDEETIAETLKQFEAKLKQQNTKG